MKELSVEEKAQKYNEALERAKSVIEQNPLMEYLKKGIEYIFPELKEREGERIRKELIEYLKERKSCESYGQYVVRYDRWIAWLEKQGEHANFLKKDKWYVCTQTYVLRGKIVVIKGQTYQAEKDNVIKGEDGCLFIDRHDGKASEYFRCWTIQDAKKGDVIYLPNGNNEYYVFIFKGIENAAVMSFAHLYQYNDGTSEVKETIDKLSSVNDAFRPATKEQRDTLFTKTKEAGYEWDSEKKELKKIEQKPAWSEEDRKIIIELIGIFESAVDGGHVSFPYRLIKDYIRVLKSCLPQTTWKPSDEQMDALETAVSSLQSTALESLYNKLKKL